MPELNYFFRSPDPRRNEFVYYQDQRAVFYVQDGRPDDGEPFMALDPEWAEPHVRAKCTTYSRLDPPYHLIGTTTGTAFASVQYTGPKEYSDFARPLDFTCTDLSDGGVFCWRGELGDPYALVTAVRRLEVTASDGRPAGSAHFRLTPGYLFLGREGLLKLAYQHDPLECNSLLHLATLAFLMTRYFSPDATNTPPRRSRWKW